MSKNTPTTAQAATPVAHDDLRAFSVRETADRLGRSEMTIRRMLRDGTLRGVLIAGRMSIPAGEVARLLRGEAVAA